MYLMANSADTNQLAFSDTRGLQKSRLACTYRVHSRLSLLCNPRIYGMYQDSKGPDETVGVQGDLKVYI